MKAKCPVCERIYESPPLGYGTMTYSYTGRQQLPRLICPACRANRKAGRWEYENSKANLGIGYNRLPPADRTRRGLTEAEWKSRHKALEIESHRVHRGEVAKPIPMWIVKLGESHAI